MGWRANTGRRQTYRPEVSRSDALGRKHKPDYWLLTLSVLLLAIGLVVVYAISPALSASRHVSNSYYVGKQLIAIGLSIVAFAITSQIPLTTWKRLYKPLIGLALFATALALILPVNPDYPAHRWVRLGSFSFQSVELVKFALMFWLAGFFVQQMRSGKITDSKAMLKPLLGVVAAIGLIIANPKLQSDLGSTGVIVAMIATMAYVAGMPFRRIMLIAGIIAIGTLLLIASSSYRRERVATFLHPEANCQTTSWQACQAIIAVGSGGMIGVGLGRSVQANGYVPEAANDSIFAIYAEVFGFVGTLVLLGLYLALFSRMKRIAERAPDDFSRLLVVGVLTWLSVQTLINIGAMIGLLPLKGITLPFISYGGTSVVFVAAAVGLVFQISHYSSFVAPIDDERSGYDNRRDRRRVRGAYHPNFGSR